MSKGNPALRLSERAELHAAHAQIESILVERDEQALGRWMEIRYDLPPEWRQPGRAGMLS